MLLSMAASRLNVVVTQGLVHLHAQHDVWDGAVLKSPLAAPQMQGVLALAMTKSSC